MEMRAQRNAVVLWRTWVAVSEVGYSYDLAYQYAAEQPITPGKRVIVPFGRGNRSRIGMVLKSEPLEVMEKQLKLLRMVVDETPVLSKEMVQLVLWLKEMTFCTYFEAVCAVLPAGFRLTLREELELVPDPPAKEQLTESELQVLQSLEQPKAKSKKQTLSVQLSAEVVEQAMESLLQKGFLQKRTMAKEKVSGQTGMKMLRLAEPQGEMEIPYPTLTKAQRKLVAQLEGAGVLSEKEACYLSGVSASVVKKLVNAGVVESFVQKPPTHSYQWKQEGTPEDIILSPEQQAAYSQIASALETGMQVFLLHGVTGSGKTSVFIRLIDTVIRQGKQAILLVPEIALTPQIVGRFCGLFGEKVAVIHSELSLGQRSDTWHQIESGKAQIIIGTRSAIFAPVQNLGIIIVDEEGERTYKSDRAPRYHAVSIAKKRCLTHQCPLVLASATPSVESYYYAKRGVYHLVEMKERYNQSALPTVEVVDMQEARQEGDTGMISPHLRQALEENLAAGKQSLLLLNRRGYHTIVSCSSCRQPVYCPNCSIPMTYHKVNDSLMCHYCGHTQAEVTVCPACGSNKLQHMGFGTQRVEEELAEMVPSARILRMDADTTMSRSAYEERFTAFRDGKYDIMLGTQMIGKGLDFPDVTLVGVLSVDKALYAGDFRSYERTFSLVTQVVGRSGRGAAAGRAILQTSLPDHYVLQLAAQQDYAGFYQQEIALRRQLIFPPICDICVIGFTGAEETAVRNAANLTVNVIRAQLAKRAFQKPIWVLHPVPCVYGKVKGKYRYQLIIKCKNIKEYRDLIRDVLMEAGKNKMVSRVHIYADMNGDIGI